MEKIYRNEIVGNRNPSPMPEYANAMRLMKNAAAADRRLVRMMYCRKMRADLRNILLFLNFIAYNLSRTLLMIHPGVDVPAVTSTLRESENPSSVSSSPVSMWNVFTLLSVPIRARRFVFAEFLPPTTTRVSFPLTIPASTSFCRKLVESQMVSNTVMLSQHIRSSAVILSKPSRSNVVCDTTRYCFACGMLGTSRLSEITDTP